MPNKSKYMYDKYTSLFSYCRENNLDYVGIVQRIKHGADVKKAIDDEINKTDNKTKYVFEGKPLSQYCKEKDLDYFKVVQRIKRGRSIEDAIDFYDFRKDPDSVD